MFRSAALLTVVFGLLVLVSGTAYATPLILNGGFETGDFTDWTVSGNPSIAVDTNNPHSGSYAADGFAVGSISYISQVIPTVVGNSYQLSWWLNNNGGTPSEFDAYAGSEHFQLANFPIGFPYSQFTLGFVATSSSTTIEFGIMQASHMYLDDINVNDLGKVPEPVSIALIGLGLVGLGLLRRRTRG